MADVHDSLIRSKNMAAIKGRNTTPEIIIRKALHRRGYRYTLQNDKLPGKPDIVLPKYNAAVFVHGCFWHHHNCCFFKWPATRNEFWKEKITRNEINDHKKQNILLKSGWRIGIIWECALRGKNRLSLDIILESISSWLQSNQIQTEIHGKQLM